jgi:hypothetical protein
MWTVEKMREMGMSEQEIKRELCEHEYDGTWRHTFMGCTRTCTKCGQMQCDPTHCGQHKHKP